MNVQWIFNKTKSLIGIPILHIFLWLSFDDLHGFIMMLLVSFQFDFSRLSSPIEIKSSVPYHTFQVIMLSNAFAPVTPCVNVRSFKHFDLRVIYTYWASYAWKPALLMSLASGHSYGNAVDFQISFYLISYYTLILVSSFLLLDAALSHVAGYPKTSRGRSSVLLSFFFIQG